MRQSTPILESIVSNNGNQTDDPILMEEILKSYYEGLYYDQSTELELQQTDCNYSFQDALFRMGDVLIAIEQFNFSKGLGSDMFNGACLVTKL